MEILRIKSLFKSYNRKKMEIPVLKDVSFSVDKGSFISIVGKSGSGKSTLLNLIGGLDSNASGEIFFEDKNLLTMDKQELAFHRRFNIGMVFQSFNLITHLTALENVMLSLVIGGTPEKERMGKALSLLELVGLEHRATHKPSELSGGESQRVAIARALANQPKMILADEPTGNLDSKTGHEIMTLMKKMNLENGLTILMITHDMELAKNNSDYLITIKDGSISN